MIQPTIALLVDLPVAQFTAQLATGNAAPGGGSAAALAGALGAGLATMAARLTIGRRRYAAVQETMLEVEAQGERLRTQLLALVDADTAAFSEVMRTFKLPAETPDEVAARTYAIQEALQHAVDIPLAVAEASVQVIHLAALAQQYGNKNASSDAAVGGMLAHAALQAAIRNVETNLEGIRDAQFRRRAEARLLGLKAKGENALRRATDAAG